ncbi:MAG: tetratricopeptide repeat protein [Gemmatimonadetes bacterium]|nr:tetratricopeptide repeat protein [Gemmatimonadota bacterium]
MKQPLVRLSLALALVAPALPGQTKADTAFTNGDWATAARLYKELQQKGAVPPGARVRAGYATLSIGDAALARQFFQAAVDAAPATGAPVALAGLAIASAHLGDDNAALTHLERAVAVGYANPTVLTGDSAFTRIASSPRFTKVVERANLNAFPCLGDTTARAFDFWIGEWDVYLTGTDRRVGQSRVDRVSAGCALVENWVARESPVNPPGNGTSLNFVEPATGTWKQVWMGSGRGQTDFVDGRYINGVLRFAFSSPDANGVMQPGRFLFHNLGPNRVRQVQERSANGGTSFQVVLDFTYIRRGSAEPIVRP